MTRSGHPAEQDWFCRAARGTKPACASLLARIDRQHRKERDEACDGIADGDRLPSTQTGTSPLRLTGPANNRPKEFIFTRI
jgi:hypothetical protein